MEVPISRTRVSAASFLPWMADSIHRLEALTSGDRAIMPRAAAAGPGAAQGDSGKGLITFLSAFVVAIIIFAVQLTFFLLLRNKLARIYKPKTYLVPERERTESPSNRFFGLMKTLFKFRDREVIQKCGLDAYFFLRYLKTLLVIFIPICCIVMPILIPINYIGGNGKDVVGGHGNKGDAGVTGLDALAWGNVKNTHTSRYTAHLLMAILVIIWVCTVMFFEMRVYIKIRQDYLTSAEHRLRASATTVLVNGIPGKWLTEEALRGLFDVFPGGVRNIWLNRDLSDLLDKISERDSVHAKLEQAETDLIKAAKKAQLKQKKAETKHSTRADRKAEEQQRDTDGTQMANSGDGISAGDKHDTPHIDVDIDAKAKHRSVDSEGIAGLAVDEAAEGSSKALANSSSLSPREGEAPPKSSPSTIGAEVFQAESITSTKPINGAEAGPAGNTVRQLSNIEDQLVKEDPSFWQFWKPPGGRYASPVPQGKESAAYMAAQAADTTTAWQKFKKAMPWSGSDLEPLEYKQAYNPDHEKHEDGEEEWAKYLKKKNRPTHNLPLFGQKWLFGIAGITKSVDTIYWCREELARLNVEIEEDQKHPERYPLMTSAFVQFEHQIAAHMACQSAIHHLPKHMTPRIVEISPRDVIWENMALSWWQGWARSAFVVAFIVAMVLLWAIPVAFTASISQLDQLISDNEWLSFLNANNSIRTVATAVAGVLPALLLGLMLILVPIIFGLFASFRGAKTGAQKAEFVQIFYFFFLFVQVFLVVSVASFFASSIDKLVENVTQLDSVTKVLNLLARNLPKAANYFFSYMILQALSVSSGTLLQGGALFVWFILAKMMDSTARNKWKRNITLNNVNWGAFFPVYTNFACIGLVYSVIAPLISIFAIITFSLLYIAHRYSMLYVTRFETDTGGVLYPRALNQTFTGIYFMELCVAGLFFIVKDKRGNNPCVAHGVVMLVVLGLTVLYQFMLNKSFSPLFRYLPITIEDEAVLRDEAFQRAQSIRFGFDVQEGEDIEKEGTDVPSPQSPESQRFKSPRIGSMDDDIEMDELRERRRVLRIQNPVKKVGAWAKDGGNELRKITLTDDQAAEYRRKQRQKALDAQRALGDALYGGMNDDIEDLTPDERDLLVRHAFKHSALRARRPVVWLPRDDLGVSDDEVRRTKAFSDKIWISNEGTGLDSKNRVVYGKNPPDFSEVDVINL